MQRRIVCASLLSMASTLPLPSFAQSAWPAKPLRLINSFPAGGPSDIIARELAQALQEQSKQSVIVENKAGAGGNVAAEQVAKTGGDGSMLMVGIDTTLTMNPHIYKPMPFTNNELKPLLIISSNGLLLGVNPALGTAKLSDVVKLGSSRVLNFSSGGNGSPGHLALEIFRDATRARMVHIPYRGNSPAVMALLSGEVDAGILSVSGMLPHVKSGKITPVAVTSRQRSKALPEVPTVAELGMKQLEAEVLTMIMVAGSTPPALVQTMQDTLLKALQSPALQRRIQSLDMDVEGLTGAAAEKRLGDLYAQYGRLAKSTKMRLD